MIVICRILIDNHLIKLNHYPGTQEIYNFGRELPGLQINELIFSSDVQRYSREDLEKWSNIDYLIGPAPKASVQQE